MSTITTIIHWLQQFSHVLPWIGLALLCVLVLTFVATIILRIADRRWVLKQKFVLLGLTPPATITKSPIATARFFAVLHGQEATRPLLHKLLLRSSTFSAEITGTKDGGIRYVVRVPESDAHTFEQAITSYLPNVRCRQIDEYLPSATDGQAIRIAEFHQTGYFAYPLQIQGNPEEHDPMAYLTGAMANLEADELVSFQLAITPIRMREAELLAVRLMHNQELAYSLGRRRAPIARFLLDGINTVLFSIIDGIGDVSTGGAGRMVSQKDQYRKREVDLKVRPARILSADEQYLASSVQAKLTQPLFRVSVRTFVATKDGQAAKLRVKSIAEALNLYKVPKYQSLRARAIFPKQLRIRQRLFVFTHRLPSLWHGSANILSAAEIADLYHFPHSDTVKTDNLVTSLSKTLAAPLSLKGDVQFDVILGRNYHHGTSTEIGLTTADRERHVYIIGGTGCGKTTMLTYAMIQDLQNGKGMAFIDPHGDAAESLLGYVPKERTNDVIYFNPDDLGYPIGLNVLELTPGLTGDELLREKDLVTESVISMFRKIFSDDDSGGHRIEYVLRNAIQTALYVENATLFTVYDLLNDPDYCKKVVNGLDNEDLKKFWKNELGKAGKFQQVKMVAGITAKIGRFLFSASAKRVLEQPKSTINFDEILDGKVLICNLSKGLIGEDTSELFGIAILAKLQLAALRRARIKQADRKPFYLYVDEFQNFATPSFVQMLSEARKYKLFLTMAEQSTSQQDDLRTVNVILANVGTIICFRSGNPADEKAILPLFLPYVEEGEISKLSSFNFYMRIAATETQEPLSGKTILHESLQAEEMAEQVIEASRSNYAKEYVTEPVEQPPTAPGEKPKKPKRKKKQSDDKDDSSTAPKPQFPKGQ